MKTHSFSIRLMWKTVLFTSLLCLAGATTAAEFSVALQSEKQEYLLGEPVVVTATITYQGEKAIDVNNPLDPGAYKESLDVSPAADAKWNKFKTHAEIVDERKDRSALPSIHFEPGTKIVRENTLVSWPKRHKPTDSQNVLVFPKAGDYLVRFVVTLGDKTFSDQIRISVGEPLDDSDKGAFAWLQADERLQKFGELDSLSPDVQDDLAQKSRKKMLSPFNELLKKYPTSTYSRYVRKVAPEHQPD